MHEHTWKEPEIYQIQTQGQENQNDWPKETPKKCPITVNQTIPRVWLNASLSEPVRVSVHMYCTHSFLLKNTLFHYFLCGNSFLQNWEARALVTDPWASGWDSVVSLPRPHLNLWPGTEAFLQAAAATWDQGGSSGGRNGPWHPLLPMCLTGPWISFPGLLPQTATHLVASNNRNLFSCSCGAQKSEIKVSATYGYWRGSGWGGINEETGSSRSSHYIWNR